MQFQVILIAWLVLGTGCANYFKRKECENTNWHQHGHKVAMSGKRLDSDDLIRQCQEVEAKFSFTAADSGFKEGMGQYCTLDSIRQLGKNGKAVNFAMCDGLQMKAMQLRHNEGLREFCQKENGYSVGTSGEIYEKLCPKDLESAFVSEYRRGRKVYLGEVIRQKENEVLDVDENLGRLQRNKLLKNDELSRLEFQKVLEQRRMANQPHALAQSDANFQRRRQDLEWEMRDLDSKVQGAEASKRSLRDEIRKLQTELIGL